MTNRISIPRPHYDHEPRKTPDLRISAAVALAFMLQTATAFMWAGAAENRIGQLENRVATREQFFERTARLEENVSAIRSSVERLEIKIERLREGSE